MRTVKRLIPSTRLHSAFARPRLDLSTLAPMQLRAIHRNLCLAARREQSLGQVNFSCGGRTVPQSMAKDAHHWRGRVAHALARYARLPSVRSHMTVHEMDRTPGEGNRTR
jgi:hypothetical protein